MVRWEELVVGEDPNVSGAWKDNHPSEKNFQGKSVKFTLHSTVPVIILQKLPTDKICMKWKLIMIHSPQTFKCHNLSIFIICLFFLL